MKHTYILLAFIFLQLLVVGQENWITVNGGYAFGKLDDTDIKLSGWRVNLSYEKNAYEGKMAHGMVIGYISTGSTTDIGNQKVEYELTSFPIYYTPKYLFGSENFKGFAKGVVGLHISNYKRIGIITNTEDDTVAFYLGLGAGAMYTINKLFISIEYEWAFAANSYYNNGFVNSAMLGLGIKF